MMKKKLFVLMTLVTWLSVDVSAQSLGVFTYDNSGKFTNVRNAPKGKVVDKIPTDVCAMIGVEKPTNGWWKLTDNTYETGDFDGKLKGSTTGYWIHIGRNLIYHLALRGIANIGKLATVVVSKYAQTLSTDTY